MNYLGKIGELRPSAFCLVFALCFAISLCIFKRVEFKKNPEPAPAVVPDNAAIKQLEEKNAELSQRIRNAEERIRSLEPPLNAPSTDGTKKAKQRPRDGRN